MDITIQDFFPVNTWSPNEQGEKFLAEDGCEPEPMWLIDGTSGREYLNETKGLVRYKCFLLSVGTPLIQTAKAIMHAFFRLLKVLTFANFWLSREGDTYDFKGRLIDTGADLARIVLFPFAIIGLELSSIYGLFSPYDGRKLYGTLERAFFEVDFLAPCFQPSATHHAFGGNINQRDAL